MTTGTMDFITSSGRITPIAAMPTPLLAVPYAAPKPENLHTKVYTVNNNVSHLPTSKNKTTKKSNNAQLKIIAAAAPKYPNSTACSSPSNDIPLELASNSNDDDDKTPTDDDRRRECSSPSLIREPETTDPNPSETAEDADTPKGSETPVPTQRAQTPLIKFSTTSEPLREDDTAPVLVDDDTLEPAFARRE